MVIRELDKKSGYNAEVFEVTIQDVVYIGKHNALQNFKQYLETKMLELEKAITTTLHTVPSSLELFPRKDGLIYEGYQKKNDS